MGSKGEPEPKELDCVVSGELRKEFMSRLARIEGEIGDLNCQRTVRLKGGKIDPRLLKAVDELIVHEYESGDRKSLWRVDCLVYAGAVSVSARSSGEKGLINLMGRQRS